MSQYRGYESPDYAEQYGPKAARYEVAIETGLTFDTGPTPETFDFEFEGRRFLWHIPPRDPDTGAECWPTVTAVVTADDWEEVHRAMERLLSALSFHTGESITPRNVMGTGIGFMRENAPPVARWPRGQVPGVRRPSIRELVVEPDDRLHLVMGYWRDGRSTGSPFFRFLAYFNALEVACEDCAGGMEAWVRAQSKRYRDRIEGQPSDLAKHLMDDRRHAVAHAIRDPGKPPDLDPNDPTMRRRFWMDCGVTSDLIRQRVRERWGADATRDVPNL